MLFGFFYSLPFAGYFFPGNSGLSSLMLMNIYFIFAIPLGFMILFFVRLINRHRLNPRIRTGMWIFFSLNVASLFALGSLMLSHFNSKTLESDVKASLNVDTLHIEHLYNPMQESLINFGDLKLGDDYLISDDVYLNFTSSDNENFEIVESREGRGKTQEEAKSFLDHVQYVSQISGNKFAYQSIFSIPAGNKWRDQKINLQVNVPLGKFITFDNNTWRIWLPGKEGKYQHPDAGSIYQMTSDGFICVTCPKEAEAPQ
ncbi:MAG: hypothetical protein KDC28_15680 [Saprospiraceae bacterium]|nr:hypothetical protein [Saprospiraceae bacterium]MCB9318050.1 hypothetical protein [Lewinellaceae bacterium]